MKVFKFGGASLKDAEGVKNVAHIIKTYASYNTVIVVSAMGKITNALEVVIDKALSKSSGLEAAVWAVESFHFNILKGLFPDEGAIVFAEVKAVFHQLRQFVSENKSDDYNFVYDQIIGVGELVSSKIVSAYLIKTGVENTWTDVRTLIKTDASFRRANINWVFTREAVSDLKRVNMLVVTQGFLGSNPENYTTTLGREGSDYTAAVLGSCLQAESVTIWKDVPGVLNADPRYFETVQLLPEISYREAVELAFYGASVIHPKTIQPLQNNRIPLFVKSFVLPQEAGTKVFDAANDKDLVPCYIVKKNQILVQLSSLDFSYIVEENMSEIFKILHLYKMKVDLMQNSAISFSVCLDDVFNNIKQVIALFQEKFKTSYITNVSLYTVRHFNAEAIAMVEKDKEILLKQRTQDTVQIITK